MADKSCDIIAILSALHARILRKTSSYVWNRASVSELQSPRQIFPNYR